MSAVTVAGPDGDGVNIDVRMVVAPVAGIFTAAPAGDITTEGQVVEAGTVLGHIAGPGMQAEVSSFCPGFLVRLLAHSGERVRVGQPIAWVHPIEAGPVPVRAVPARRAAPGPTPVLPLRFLGLGSALPPRRVSNDDLSRTLDTSDEWITERTGIKARRIHDPGTTTSDLAARAATGALAASGVGPDDIDVVIVATGTPDSPVPATAARVAAQLGIEASAYDVSGACCGFVHALHNAAGLLADPSIGHVLVIGAERYSTLVDPTDRGTAILFGDGAGAVVVGRAVGGGSPSAATPGILASDLGGAPSALDVIETPVGGRYIEMDGQELFRRATRAIVSSSKAALDRAGATASDVDLFIPHQANARIITAAANRLGMTEDQVVLDVAEHGNTSAASIPLALAHAHKTGRLRPGSRVLLSAIGAGLDWATLYVRWGA